ncbi:CCR4-NOT transcription complex subunit 3 [Lamellibrachia satsuma]|nr:CCR4-NOT transcription complex subunit 3 [Lamellibrachia satsuma]
MLDSEGVETFEDIWKKVHNAANSNQKEKYEADLKKEIKKLQRLRDQIKTWVASNEIKDKRVLLDNRKLIETQMERFKVVERETKTKAYSKEGLGAATKLDPKEKEKEDITSWLSHCIDDLNLQVDQFESEIEVLMAKKKKLDRGKQDRLDELKGWLEKHKYHIAKLEAIMRIVDNDAIELGQIKTIRDNVEYYVASSQDPDFEYDDECIYDDLDLDELGQSIGGSLLATSPQDEDHFANMSSTPTSTNSSSPSPSPNVANHSKVEIEKAEDDRKRHKSQTSDDTSFTQKGSLSNGSNNSSCGSTIKVAQTTPAKQIQPNNGTLGSTPQEGGTSHRQPSPPPGQVYAQVVGSQHNNTTAGQQPRIPLSTGHLHQPNNRTATSNLWNDKPLLNSIDHSTPSSSSNNSSGLTLNVHSRPFYTQASSSLPMSSLSISSSSSSSSNSQSPVVLGTMAPSPVSSSSVVTVTPPSQQQLVPQHSSATSIADSTSQPPVTPLNESKVIMNGPTSAGAPESKSPVLTSLKSMAQQVVKEAGLTEQTEEVPTSQESTTTIIPTSECRSLFDTLTPFPSQLTAPSPEQQQQQQQHSPQTTTIHLNPLLGVAPLGPQPLSKEHCYQHAMLEAAYHHLPHPSDSDRLRLYLPRNPCPTPAYYAQVPPHHSDTVEFFQRLSTETLFFIFYYMEGTKAQYLAAKALKKQSWRFHTKYMMWFQRHEEPKTITEDYEQGTYIYFDYEKWGQRKKEGFTFEYRYLEDRDLN